MKRLIRNAIRTPDGTILDSRSRHDYVTHKDENGKEYMVDGGLEYSRMSINGDEVDISMYYEDTQHKLVREVLKWGTYGITGKEPYKLVPVSSMDTMHIQAVIDTQPNMLRVIRDCMLIELRSRGVHYEDRKNG